MLKLVVGLSSALGVSSEQIESIFHHHKVDGNLIRYPDIWLNSMKTG